ncbi:MAG TPA: hypothetical protein VGT60_01935 [Candidatus Limnocylindria bacterium]|nr:hypothetical protein [Candidatus Limnocylindria bacterium]
MLRFIAYALVVSACGTVTAPGPTVAPTPAAPAALLLAPTEACGTVRAWTAPTPTQAGSLTIGSATHTVNAGTNHGATGVTVKAGVDRCLFGGLDGQPQPYHGATPIDSPFCGAVLALRAATASAAGSLTLLHFASITLPIAPRVDLGTPRLGVRRCITVGVTERGDAEARGRAAPSILDLESNLWCGSVGSYAAGSSISIGSRRWEMAAGTAYDTAGPNGPDRTSSGKPMCLTAALDDAGRITRYLTSEMPPGETGLVTGYTPATGTARGTLVFYYAYVRVIAAGASLTDVKVGSRTCVKFGLDPSGDRVITGSAECGGVGL